MCSIALLSCTLALGCRDLQPPPQLAAEWATQRDTFLDEVTAKVRASSRNRRQQAARRGAAAAGADADAVAAAERTMQELLVGSAT